MYRCLTLADKLTAFGCEVEFISTEHLDNLNTLIALKGYKIHRLSISNTECGISEWLGRSWQDDAQLTCDILSKSTIDWLIVDHYELDFRWHNAVKIADFKLMVIDDLANREYSCDRLLDQTFERKVQDYRPYVETTTALLLGTDYGLLRDEFAGAGAQAINRRQQYVSINSILISLGGSDINNITGKLLKLLEMTKLPDSICLNVVVGPNNSNKSSLEQAIKESRFQCELYSSVTNMAELLVNADIAIGAAGSSAWERCVLSLPTLSITLADNQRTIADKLERRGVAISLGEQEALTTEVLDRAIAKCHAFYQQMVQKTEGIVDGIGASRVAISLFTVLDTKGNELYLKRVSWQDCERLFEWQQASSTRKYALTPTIPSWKEHCAWFKHKVAEPNSFLFMLRRHQTDVGMVRLDPLEEFNTYQVSILTGPDFYRQGVATSALRLIRHAFKSITIMATILPANLASLSLFKSMGYVQISKTQWLQYPIEETNE